MDDLIQLREQIARCRTYSSCFCWTGKRRVMYLIESRIQLNGIKRCYHIDLIVLSSVAKVEAPISHKNLQSSLILV